MMNNQIKFSRGFTLLEVLITVVILAIGLLGLTNLQTKLHMSQMESYQRAQAVVLMQDFANRIQANGGDAAGYVTGTDDPVGTVDPPNALVDCGGMTGADLDLCEWGNMLKGGSECTGTATECAEVDREENVGAMIGARGCVEALPVGAGACAPSSYRITVAWQGLFETAAPAGLACGQGEYGDDDALRRAVSTTVTVGRPRCL